ncbi:C-type lectin domain family 4 member D-like isoform X3 [Chanodichthys erythropterus]|uniref:C-type lectin domain family 4 member D-like isoform X3 n=1 Tax=Chanodichthys erythropterus TaxID=933992 RepID=UPI00351E6A46
MRLNVKYRGSQYQRMKNDLQTISCVGQGLKTRCFSLKHNSSRKTCCETFRKSKTWNQRPLIYPEILITHLDLRHRVTARMKEKLKSAYFMITAEREEMKSHKSKAEELDQTRFCIKANNTELTLDLESSVTSSSDQSEKKASKQENMCALDGFFTSFEEKNWSDSRHFCQDRGGYLVMIKSEEKQRLVTSFMKKRINKNVWIGLSDTENEGIMKWVDNSTLNEGFWIKGEPNNYGDEDCVTMYLSPDLANWNDFPCSIKCKFICEY